MTGAQAEILTKFAGPDLSERCKLLTLTLGGGIQAAVTIGTGYKGVRFTTALTDCYVAVDTDVPTAATSSSTSVDEDDFSAGTLLSGTEREARIIPLGMKSRVFNLKSATGGAVLIELF